MAPLVLDASLTLALLLREAGRPLSLEKLESLLPSADVMAPAIWQTEVVNGLLSAVRRGRIGLEGVRLALAECARLPVRRDRPESDPTRLFELAQAHGLTAYDASYLDLALREGAMLATFDRELEQAARRAGVPLME